MTIQDGKLQVPAVVQLIDSTGGGVPVVLHLHRTGDGDEAFEWLAVSAGRYEFEDIAIAWEACPVLLDNEQERRRQDEKPWEKLRVTALVVDGAWGASRRPPGMAPEDSLNHRAQCAEQRKPVAPATAAGPRAARPRRIARGGANQRGPAGPEVYARTAARLGEHEEHEEVAP